MSDFINDVKHYGAMATKLLAIISKNPRGIKSMAKASIRLSNSWVNFSTNDLTVIDEYVRFKGLG
jgi:hypothetical protein